MTAPESSADMLARPTREKVIRAPDRSPVVRITVAEEPAGPWQFCVADNGIGIPSEFAEKVFVIFQRLHGRDAYPGTGIGLAICKRIVEHHGGDISIDPVYPDGTRICFTLPRIDVAAQDQADDDPDPGTSADGISPASASPSPAAGSSTSPSASTEGIPA